MSDGREIVLAESVGRRFGRQEVFSDITLELQRGDIHALIGPNGSGKTTLLRILAGILEPSSGRVRIAGKDPVLPSVRQMIGWVPSSERSFYFRISGLENLIFFARLYGMSRRVAEGRARELLHRVGLEEAAGMAAALYSAGMLKRLAVARAFLTGPDVLLLDEATHDLDPRGAEITLELVRVAAEAGTAVVWATQLLDELSGFVDSVTVLASGKAVFSGPVEEFVRRAAMTSYAITFNGSAGVTAEAANRHLGPLGWVADDGSDRFILRLQPDVAVGDALTALTSGGLRVTACTLERSEMRAAYLAVTEGAQ